MRQSKLLKIKQLERLHREGYLKHPVGKDEFEVQENHLAWSEERSSRDLRANKKTRVGRR